VNNLNKIMLNIGNGLVNSMLSLTALTMGLDMNNDKQAALRIAVEEFHKAVMDNWKKVHAAAAELDRG
jgi:hypothetical protein